MRLEPRSCNRTIRFDYPPTTVPDLVTPLAPLTEVQTADPLFSWSTVTGATRYQLIVFDRILGERVTSVNLEESTVCVDNTCSYRPEELTLSIGDRHYWRVRARNAVGWGEYTDALRFNYVAGGN